MKTLCGTHHFYYNGNVCPFCVKDRSTNIAKKFDKKAEKETSANKPKEENRDVTMEQLQLLKEKFGSR